MERWVKARLHWVKEGKGGEDTQLASYRRLAPSCWEKGPRCDTKYTKDSQEAFQATIRRGKNSLIKQQQLLKRLTINPHGGRSKRQIKVSQESGNMSGAGDQQYGHHPPKAALHVACLS